MISEVMGMLILGREEMEKVIEPAAEWVYGVDTVRVQIGLEAKGGDAGGSGGLYIFEEWGAVNVWALGVYYWLEIVGVLCLVMVVWGLIGIWRRRRKLADVQVGEAYCGKCGYGLTGLSKKDDVCPECGCEGAGEGGKRRKVMSKRVKGGVWWRWWVVGCAFGVAVLMGVMRYGADGKWEWVDHVAKVMGADTDKKILNLYTGENHWIRQIGAKRWFVWKSRWGHQVLRGLGMNIALLGEHSRKGSSIVRLEVKVDEGGEAKIEREVMKEQGGVVKFECVGDWYMQPYRGRLPRPMMFRVGERLWFYEGMGMESRIVCFIDETRGELFGVGDTWQFFTQMREQMVRTGEMYEYEMGEGKVLLHHRNRDWNMDKREKKENHVFYLLDMSERKLSSLDGETVRFGGQGDSWEMAKLMLMWFKGEQVEKKVQMEREVFFEMLGDGWMGLSQADVGGGKLECKEFNRPTTTGSVYSVSGLRWPIGESLWLNSKGEVYLTGDVAERNQMTQLAVDVEGLRDGKLVDGRWLYLVKKHKSEEGVIWGVSVIDLKGEMGEQVEEGGRK
ncbi:hypothetical protein JD969_12530 [Planctomycetota bacterium]|nr:hypothetical protein JD969_12530 [Planctomycetota bacterium]